MNAKSCWLCGGLGLMALVVVGCHEPAPEPSALSEQMIREMRLATPTVGGPSKESSVPKNPAEIVPSVEAALKDSGVSVVQAGSSDTGRWLLGKSLADRRVLVQILPVYPGRSTVKVTVEGADGLTRELLTHLSSGIDQRVR